MIRSRAMQAWEKLDSSPSSRNFPEHSRKRVPSCPTQSALALITPQGSCSPIPDCHSLSKILNSEGLETARPALEFVFRFQTQNPAHSRPFTHGEWMSKCTHIIHPQTSTVIKGITRSRKSRVPILPRSLAPTVEKGPSYPLSPPNH